MNPMTPSQIRLIFPICQKHVNHFCFLNGTHMKQSRHKKDQDKKEQGEQYGVWKECPCRLVAFSIGGEQHCSNKL